MWQVLATVLVAAAATAAPAQPPVTSATTTVPAEQTAPAPARALARPPQTQQHKPPNWRCFVRDAMVFYDRVHVRCYNKTANGLTFFAVDTSQPIAVSLVTRALV